jgi:hypothetical protein
MLNLYIIIFIIILIISRTMYLNLYNIEKYSDISTNIIDQRSDFYLSPIRVRDYQDIISITESQLINTNDINQYENINV